MSYLLNIAYLAILTLASPWLLYAAIFKGKYREGFAEKFLGRVPRRRSLGFHPGQSSPHARDGIPGYRPCIWLHAVSVGEVNLLAMLLGEIEGRRPDVECVISTTTMTGYALAKKKHAPRTVFYCPLDFSWAVKSALRRIRPDVLLLAELELWPNLIRMAKTQGVRVAVVNGRLSEKSFRGYSRIRTLVRSILEQIDVIAVQNDEYAGRFRALLGEKGSGVFFSDAENPLSSETPPSKKKTPDPVRVTGSLKFDGAQTDRQNPKTRELAALAGITDDDIVLLAGSTQEPEEGLALAAFAELKEEFPQLRLVLVPRHPDRFDEVAAMLDRSGLLWQRRSTLVGTGSLACTSDSRSESASPGTGWPPVPTGARILLVDTIGELGAWWGTAQIAYVGGSMGSRGGQNMIEPAAYGAVVAFGPNTWNFRDIVQMLLAADAAVVVADGGELTEFVRQCLQDPSRASELGEAARALVAGQLGATARTIDLVEPLLPRADLERRAA